MSLAEIRHIAETFPEQIEICWDKLDEDPKYKEDFERLVSQSLKMIPAIEGIYTKLTNGESVIIEGEASSLDPEQIEEYKEMVEQELFAGYQMQVMWDTYQKVKNVINL